MNDPIDYYDLADVPTLPAEEVARIFLENECLNAFSAIKRGAYKDFEYQQTLTRLTSLITRARVDGMRSKTECSVDEATEILAIRCAKGNNGGQWATHYTEGQKEYWRQFVRDLRNSSH